MPGLCDQPLVVPPSAAVALEAAPEQLDAILGDGNARARDKAASTMREVRAALGLGGRRDAGKGAGAAAPAAGAAAKAAAKTGKETMRRGRGR